MKFLADMGISPRVVAALQSDGFDAVHLQTLELGRLPDDAILLKALDEERILLTHDLDFGELLAVSGASLPSVVVFRLKDMRPLNVSHHLNLLISQHGDLLERGAIASVVEGAARIRKLPIG